MASHASHDVRKDLKRYIAVFVLLLVGTILTVAAWKWGGDVLAKVGINPTLTVTIVIALFIALIKAFLVAGYFMHLISEKKLIYAVLAITAIKFVALLALPAITHGNGYWIEE